MSERCTGYVVDLEGDDAGDTVHCNGCASGRATEASLQEARELLEAYMRMVETPAGDVPSNWAQFNDECRAFLATRTASLVTTQTGPTCGECGSLMIPDPAWRGWPLRCVNCRRGAQPSEGTATTTKGGTET